MSISAEWFLAFVVDDTVPFDSVAHAVQDTELLGFTFSQRETEFAALRLLTKNKISGLSNWALGLLRPDQKKWAWFSWSLNGAEPRPLALLRLQGIPSDVFLSTVTLDFSARPSDFNEQKVVLNDSMRVAPYWLDWLVDEQKRENMDIILDTYAGAWYVDPVTHEVSLSDLLLGEDGTEVFQANEHAMDGLQMTLGETPLTSVTVDAELTWTQRAVGNVGIGFISSSYTLKADSYPKVGASMGDGWTVLSANVTQPFTFETKSVQSGKTIHIKWWDGDATSLTVNESHDKVRGPGINLPEILTNYSTSSSYSGDSPPKLTSWSVQTESSTGLVPLYDVTAAYVVGYDAKRPFTEHVTLTLQADVQPIVTLPGDDETMRIDGITSTDLSEPIDDVVPMGDPRRRSFTTQDNGMDTIRHMVLLARAQLRKRARAVEITFQPFLDRLEDLKLNRNVQLYDWRIPGGSAIGKIVAFTLTLTPPVGEGSGVSVGLECTIGCAVGNGGTVAAVGGEEEYVDDEYIDADQGYQQYDGQVLTFNDEVGITPPPFAPSDDGLDFISGFSSPNDPNLFDVPISYNLVASEQAGTISSNAAMWGFGGMPVSDFPPAGYDSWSEARQAAVEDRNQSMANLLSSIETEVTFKLKSMTKDFKTDVPITVTSLKIPQMINLGAT